MHIYSKLSTKDTHKKISKLQIYFLPGYQPLCDRTSVILTKMGICTCAWNNFLFDVSKADTGLGDIKIVFNIMHLEENFLNVRMTLHMISWSLTLRFKQLQIINITSDTHLQVSNILDK